MEELAEIGLEYVERQIEQLEKARPGWVAMFYVTGSFEGDIKAAEMLRKKFDLPRPKPVAASISLAKTAYMERLAIAQAERDFHKAKMKNDWFYWLGVKLGLVRGGTQ